MALKNLYDMVKADRYTQDGREAIIKAQEEETEDKVYQIGEISQKTGLQKTANGWVKPKSGKQPGAKKQNAPTGSKKIDYQVTEKGGKFYATGHQFSDGSQLHAGPFGSEKELHEFMNGSPYKSTAESKPGAKKEEPKNVHGAEVDKIYERQLKRIKELKAKGFTDEQIDNDKIIKQTKEDMKNVGKKPESKPAAQEEIGKFYTKFKDAQSAYDAGRQTFTDGGYKIYNTPQGYKVVDDPKIQQRMEAAGYEIEADVPEGTKPPKGPGEKPATPRREAVSAGRMMKDLDGNFWSRPEDFKEDITSRGWDVDEMTNEYAVISNEAGSQYEVRFDDHSDDGDLTVRNFKALQIDEDDDDDSLEDSAPSLSEIVDRVYNIGEISEKTGLQKTAQGWKPPKETKFGKVKQNKEGQWGVQTKQGKGSDFLKHKSEKEASRALANYTAGYNTTERSKQDPHSDQARQVKHWDKETEKIRKQNRAEGRAAHAAQFQKPTTGNNLPDIPDFKGMESGDYDKKLRAEGWTTGGWEGNGTHASAIFKKGDRTIRVNEGQPGKITSVQEISKPAGKLPKGVTKVRPISPQDKLDYGKSHYLDPNSEETKQADEIVNKWFESEGKEIMPDLYLVNENGEARAFSTRAGLVNKLAYMIKNDKPYDLTYISRKDATAKDAAPRVLTGDCRIRIRKEKPALTGDTKIRVRK